jgi:hypothetical protein
MNEGMNENLEHLPAGMVGLDGVVLANFPLLNAVAGGNLNRQGMHV